jgi:enoyl-CoA hydratase/carnithine racemase
MAIGQPEVNLGLIPGFGGTQRLPRVVGNGWATRMILSGEPLNDQQALQSSLVTELVPLPQLQSHVEKLAQTILTRGPQAVRLAKKLVKGALGSKLSAGLEAEAYAFGNTFDSNEALEGTQAFIEKRLPRFEQRK